MQHKSATQHSQIDIQFADTKIKIIMAKNFAAIAFTDAVKAMQEKSAAGPVMQGWKEIFMWMA